MIAVAVRENDGGYTLELCAPATMLKLAGAAGYRRYRRNLPPCGILSDLPGANLPLRAFPE